VVSSEFPPVVAIFLQLALVDILQQDAARLLILEKLFVYLAHIPQVFLVLDGASHFNSCAVEHLEVAVKDSHH
jgi:hypothetical protein